MLMGAPTRAAKAETRGPVLVGDIDCDGHPDSISYTVAPKEVRVVVKFGQHDRADQSLTFPIDAYLQNGLCAAPAKVRLESLDFDPKTQDLGELHGFRRSTTCKGVVLEDLQCDAIHIYWDHDARRLAYWRR